MESNKFEKFVEEHKTAIYISGMILSFICIKSYGKNQYSRGFVNGACEAFYSINMIKLVK